MPGPLQENDPRARDAVQPSLTRRASVRNDFLDELARWGPNASYPTPSPHFAHSYCRRLAQSHYENFSVASLLLPRRLWPHFHAVYAYCRWADDLGDETGGGDRALALLQWWREELLRCYVGQDSVPVHKDGQERNPILRGPRHPVMVALARTIRRFNIPPAPFLDLIKAFEQDQLIKEYETYSQLLEYCRYSANPVGHLVLYLCECFDEKRARLADLVCTGLQLANFWQDVRRDADIGRIYLPAEDRRHFGFTDDDLQAHHSTPAFRALVRFQVERARELFHRGQALVPLMPGDVQIDIELFIRGGLGILDKIAAQKYDVWEKRPILSKWEIARVVAQTAFQFVIRNWFTGFHL
ncbi:MAG: squalene synthase HpnC [Gemmataceae bacterium]|nr:squalene synthase HpnC [Gemmataceae bacterium]